MNSKNFSTLRDIKIYSINYLMNNELTDNDLSNLLDNNKISLKYSLIIGMFRLIKSKKRNYEIDKIIKTDNWNDNIWWTKDQLEKYERMISKVYMNVYQYSEMKSLSLAQWFISIYGFRVK